MLEKLKEKIKNKMNLFKTSYEAGKKDAEKKLDENQKTKEE